MVRDDRDKVAFAITRFAGNRSGALGAIASAALTTAAVLLGVCLLGTTWSTADDPHASKTAPTASSQDKPPLPSERLFLGWPKPDVALLISGQLHGYLQPCGCSEIQLGGLARRFNLIKKLKTERGWNVVAGDLGDVPQAGGPQALLKYKYAMRAFKLMDYTAASFGENEMRLGLATTLGEFALNESKPRIVAANLKDRATVFPDMVASGAISTGPGLKVGFIGIIDPGFAELYADQDLKFDNNVKDSIESAMKEFKAPPDLLVLLLQVRMPDPKDPAPAAKPKLKSPLEYATEIARSQKIAKIARIDVIVVPTPEEEASAKPEMVDKTMIVTVGQRGRYVGVVGAVRSGNAERPFDLRYQMVEIAPEYETPEGQDATNPIHALLQEYAEYVKKNDLLAEYMKNRSKHPLQVQLPGSKYEGSQKCMKCHEDAYAKWEKSAHAHAYATLEKKAIRPTLRQYDGECVRCHITGGSKDGFYETGFSSEIATPNLKNVGCEACHGPASLHAKKPNDKTLYPLINPMKYKPAGDKALAMNDACMKCHDGDNSPKFKVETYWPKIEHMTPPP